MVKTILIVDDVAINRTMLRSSLGNEYEVLEAANGKEALSILKKNTALSPLYCWICSCR